MEFHYMHAFEQCASELKTLQREHAALRIRHRALVTASKNLLAFHDRPPANYSREGDAMRKALEEEP
jgi:hypothetical protein